MHSTALLRAALPRTPRSTLSPLLRQLPSSAPALLARNALQRPLGRTSALSEILSARSAPSLFPALRRSFATAPSTASPSSSSSHSHSSGKAPPPPPPEDDGEAPLSQRIKALFRKHGWTALVIYLLLSALDFGAIFLLICAVGADRVREAEDWVLRELGWSRKGVDGEEQGRIRAAVEKWKNRHGKAVERTVGVSQEKMVEGGEAHESVEASVVAPTDVARKAEEKGYSAYATTAVLAYAIHKTALLPFRVGVTVAITPKVVRMLQGWGWKVGMAKSGAAAAATAAAAGKEASS
ncbi:hypothetical protein JCM10213_000346 [Rhodosporidiobolus nylandii]